MTPRSQIAPPRSNPYSHPRPRCSPCPLPVVVPCHRVVRSDGTIGQYVGGVEAKRALLTLETG